MDNIKIAIVGLGYVGLPLAIAFSKKFDVIGFDNDTDRVKSLNQGFDWTLEVEETLLKSTNINFTSNTLEIAHCNIYIITVPTPVDESYQPDLLPLINVSKTIGDLLKKGDIVIYESTVYPGVTEDVCVPNTGKFFSIKI